MGFLRLLLLIVVIEAAHSFQLSPGVGFLRSWHTHPLSRRLQSPQYLGPQNVRSRPRRVTLAVRMEDNDASVQAWMGPGQVMGDPSEVEGPVSPVDGWGVDKSHPRWTKNTKQVATVGPASETKEMLQKLFEAGVDMFRLNFSHGAHQEKKQIVNIIRQLEREYRHPIGILADLQGPKLRVGTFADGPVDLEDGQLFTFDLDVDALGDSSRVSLPHPEIIDTLKAGDTVLLDDGKLRMTVQKKLDKAVQCRVDIGGALSNRKGVNVPSIVLPISPMTQKDRDDLEAALAMGVDWVALSFVQRPEDVEELRALCGEHKVCLMSKIEKPSAVKQLDRIVEVSDGCMVARGDLGVEMQPEVVPIIQKQIIDACRRQGKPVVVATQMLESMISSPIPTRAEAGDVANAVYDGADAVMLSAESAAGRYPEESVRMQQRIIDRVEDTPQYMDVVKSRVWPEAQSESLEYDAIAGAAAHLATKLSAKAVITFSRSGATARRASRMRMTVPCIAMTPDVRVARQLSLYWGIYPAYLSRLPQDTFDDMLARACGVAWDKGFAEAAEDKFVVTAGLPMEQKGAANIIRILPASGPQSELEPSGNVAAPEGYPG